MSIFHFELDPYDANHINGFEMGHISIEYDGKTISSKNGNASDICMLFLSISDLLCGLAALSKNNSYEFIGVDSSFRVLFTKKKNVIAIVSKKIEIEIESEKLMNDLFSSVKCFWLKQKPKIPPNDISIDDIENSLSNLSESLNIT